MSSSQGDCKTCDVVKIKTISAEGKPIETMSVSCWTARNTKSLITMIVVQLIFTGIIMTAIILVAIYVVITIRDVRSAAKTIAGVTRDTAIDLRAAANNLGMSAKNLGQNASTVLQGIGAAVTDLFRPRTQQQSNGRNQQNEDVSSG